METKLLIIQWSGQVNHFFSISRTRIQCTLKSVHTSYKECSENAFHSSFNFCSYWRPEKREMNPMLKLWPSARGRWCLYPWGWGSSPSSSVLSYTLWTFSGSELTLRESHFVLQCYIFGWMLLCVNTLT